LQAALEDLRERLLRAGVKPDLAARYAAELADHYEDLLQTETPEAALLRLGSPEVLARAMLTQPDVRSLTARAPWATLALGPLAAMLMGYVVPVLILFVGVRAFAAGLDYGRAVAPGSWPFVVLYMLSGFDEHVLPLLAGWAAVAIALRQRAGLEWLLPGIVLTAFLGGGLFMMVDWQTGRPAAVHFGLGLEFASPFCTMTGRGLVSGLFNLIAILAPYAALRGRVGRSEIIPPG
jgi:hypothetical protein